MSAAARLRELHELKHTGKMVATDERRPEILTWVHDEGCPLCLNAAVIEAAEKVAHCYTAEAEDWNDGEFALWSKDDLVCSIVNLRSQVAALSARMGGE